MSQHDIVQIIMHIISKKRHGFDNRPLGPPLLQASQKFADKSKHLSYSHLDLVPHFKKFIDCVPVMKVHIIYQTLLYEMEILNWAPRTKI